MSHIDIRLNDPGYPRLLKEISSPPPVLHVRGKLKNEEPSIAIVGTRKPSRYGIEAAEFFSRELAMRGFTIVSGLAFGIDKAVHQSCIDAGGRTIAVLASGVDRITPTSHIGLAKQILESGGSIVSEFPLGADARPETFPQRNRLISGLSLAILVIEAPETSGALITARFAAEQNRDVFVVPGSIFSPNFNGSHSLLREGAILARNPDDLIDELKQNVILPFGMAQKSHHALTEQEQKLLEIITLHSEIDVDDLAKQAALTITELNSLLTMLEMKRYIRKENEKICLNKTPN